MPIKQSWLTIGLFFALTTGFAEPNLSPIETPYWQLQRLLAEKKPQLAYQQAQHYLQQNPLDGDVRFALGQIYFNLQQYQAARFTLLQVIQQTPSYWDAWLVLINTDIHLNNLQEALFIADFGLLFNPWQSELWKKRQDLRTLDFNINPPYQFDPFNQEVGKKYHDLIYYPKPHQQRITLKTQKSVAAAGPTPKPYLNEIGTYQQNYYISDRHQVWDYTTLYYGRHGDLGVIYGKINYANRLRHQAAQAEIEAYPKLNQYIYLDLQIAFANQPMLFPNQLYGGEIYVTIPQKFDFSLGGKYNHVDSLHQFSSFTASIAKRYQQSQLTYRPTFYDPSSGKRSLMHQLDCRHYVHEPNFYYGITVAAGSSPDLANLTTVDFLVTHNTIFSPYFNFALFNERLLINASFYYQHQVFDIPLVRNWVGGTVQLSWKY